LRRRRDTFRNGCSTDFTYDAAGRSIAFHHRGPTNASLLNLVHLYDAAGNRRHDWQSGSEVITASQPYVYDALHRLITGGENAKPLPDLKTFEPTGAKRDLLTGQADVDLALAPFVPPAQEIKRSYVYDAGSNLTAEVISGLHTQTDVDLLDQIKGQAYDGDGNPVSIGNRALQYDQDGHLVKVNGGAAPFSATYDAMGRRIAIREGQTDVRLIYDGFSEIAEYRDGVLFSEHIIASPPDGRVLLAANGHDFVIHQDLVGSTRLLTDETGVLAARYEFEPYGRVLPGGTDLPFCRHRFMGREWDAGIGLYHFRARHYDVETGRFLQRDPVEPAAGESAYRALGSSPLGYVDPMGTNTSHAGDIDEKGIEPEDSRIDFPGIGGVGGGSGRIEKIKPPGSSGKKAKLKNSGWLNKRYPDKADQRRFTDRLKAGHGEGEPHEHLAPGSKVAEERLKEWEQEEGRRKLQTRQAEVNAEKRFEWYVYEYTDIWYIKHTILSDTPLHEGQPVGSRAGLTPMTVLPLPPPLTSPVAPVPITAPTPAPIEILPELFPVLP
jgi:RHS repeat-associated protein